MFFLLLILKMKLIAAGFFGFALASALFLIFYFRAHRKPPVYCGKCGWAGKEDELDTYGTDEHDEYNFSDDFKKKTWLIHCPDCGSNKIVYEPKKEK